MHCKIFTIIFLLIQGEGILGTETQIRLIPSEKDYISVEGKLCLNFSEMKTRLTEILDSFENLSIHSAGQATLLMKDLYVFYQNLSLFEDRPSSFTSFMDIVGEQRYIHKNHPLSEWIRQKIWFLDEYEADKNFRQVIYGKIFRKTFEYLEEFEDPDLRLEKPFPDPPITREQRDFLKEKVIQKINENTEGEEKAELLALADCFVYKDDQRPPEIQCLGPSLVPEEMEHFSNRILIEKMNFFIYQSAIELLSDRDKEKVEKILGSSWDNILKGNIKSIFKREKGENLREESEKENFLLKERKQYWREYGELIAISLGSFMIALYLPSAIIKSKFYQKKMRSRNKNRRKIIEQFILPLMSGFVGAVGSFLSVRCAKKAGEFLIEN